MQLGGNTGLLSSLGKEVIHIHDAVGALDFRIRRLERLVSKHTAYVGLLYTLGVGAGGAWLKYVMGW